MVAVALIHLSVGVIPQLPMSISTAWQWGVLAALLVSAVPVAWIGLKLMRQGRWDGPSRISILWNRLLLARARGQRGNFAPLSGRNSGLNGNGRDGCSPAFRAGWRWWFFHFIFFVGFKWAGVDAPPPEAILILMLIGPLLLSGVMGPALAKFDPARFNA